MEITKKQTEDFLRIFEKSAKIKWRFSCDKEYDKEDRNRINSIKIANRYTFFVSNKRKEYWLCYGNPVYTLKLHIDIRELELVPPDFELKSSREKTRILNNLIYQDTFEIATFSKVKNKEFYKIFLDILTKTKKEKEALDLKLKEEEIARMNEEEVKMSELLNNAINELSKSL